MIRMKSTTRHRSDRRAYTLVEALVGSSILLIGVAAAASMSLSLVTQEEINERSVRAFNYLDNAARLYRLGVAPPEIEEVLPPEPVVTSLDFSQRDVAVSGIGAIPATTIRITWRTTSATSSGGASPDWTGGDPEATRTESVEVIRAGSQLTEPLPRSQWAETNP